MTTNEVLKKISEELQASMTKYMDLYEGSKKEALRSLTDDELSDGQVQFAINDCIRWEAARLATHDIYCKVKMMLETEAAEAADELMRKARFDDF